MTQQLNDAKRTLIYYFETLYNQCGLTWTHENSHEVECVVEDIWEAAWKEAQRRSS